MSSLPRRVGCGTTKHSHLSDGLPRSTSPMGWWFGLAPATLEFWVRLQNERNQGKQAHPVLKYRVPHGSHTSLGSSYLIAHVPSTVILPPRAQLCIRYCSNKQQQQLPTPLSCCRNASSEVIYSAFLFIYCSTITSYQNNFKKKSGEVKDSVIFPFFFYFISCITLFSPLVSISQIIN